MTEEMKVIETVALCQQRRSPCVILGVF